MNPDSHVHENIPAYLAGELDKNECRRVELHVHECESCRRELDDQKRLDEVLSHAKTLSPGPKLIQGVMRQVRQERKSALFNRRVILPWLAAAAVIAIILFLLRIQKDTALPVDVVKKSPIVKPENPPQQPKLKSDQEISKPESVPQIVKKQNKDNQAPLPPLQKESPAAPLTPEEAEIVAQLDELENMEIISNYENLENLEIALIDEGGGSFR